MAKDETVVMSDSQFRAMELPVDAITVDETWNNRVALDGADTFHKGTKDGGDKPAMAGQSVEELAKLINQSKNFVPVSVSLRPDGSYFLVAGFRRMAAVKLLGWKMIPATVAPMDAVQEVEWNILENKGRKDLSTFETARGVKRYADILAESGKGRKGGKDADGKGAEGYGAVISKRLGISRTAVNLYIRLFSRLHPRILKAWEMGEALPVALMDKWASEELPEQLKLLKMFQKMQDDGAEGEAAEGGEGAGGNDTASNEPGKPSKALFVEALVFAAEWLKAAETPEDKALAKGIIQGLDFALGKRQTLNGVNIKEASEKRKAKAKEEAKMEAKAEKDAEKAAKAASASAN